MLAQTASVDDVPQKVDLDPGIALEKIDKWVDGVTRLLPNLIVAIVLFAIIWFASALVKRTLHKQFDKHGRENLGAVLGGFAKWAILVIGFLLCATIVIPSMKPGDLIAGLGISSVAIGFAFKDILQNWLAGLLILLRQPFQINDQISVNGHEGTVERIETRATIIKTYDGQRIVVPNSDIYTNSVLVRTAHDVRRSEYDIGIGYGDDVETACSVIERVLAGVEGVEADPAPEALPWDLAASWVTVRARWWTDSRRTNVAHVHSRIIMAVKRALDEERIDMPFDTQVHLFHDQTESDDGIRGSQREGWPNGKEKETKPRWKAQIEESAKISSDSARD
ncbi:mechanosensitive ion channel family protein [Luteolibacter sp. AS25]|uniref:mechanosensitive ion channel family protein n=1 Tax=Luteolibacter sp. AS25 TaxID=3135776 RepID=UPI00398B1536